MTNWWSDFFDESFADLLLERSSQEKLSQEVDFLVSELDLTSNQLVFDQCCGSGEVSCAIAKRGMRVIGVDQSEPYITLARKKAAKDTLNCTFYQDDALTFVPAEKCDAAFNWYTSFGYSESDTVNRKMLECAYASLKSGGKFVLDYTNPAFIFQHFTEHKIFKCPIQGQEMIVLKECEADLRRGMLISEWTYLSPDGKRKTKKGESRIYFARDLEDMFKECGFEVLSFKGNLSHETLTKNSARCIVTARKVGNE